MDKTCLLACGVISGWGAVTNRAKVLPGQSVCVVGSGGVGLNAIQGAAYSGAFPIVAVDILDSKLETAKKFGATHTVNSRTSRDAVKEVFDITYGRGADYVFQVVAGSISCANVLICPPETARRYVSATVSAST